jgi:hypothetical protein
MNGSTVGKKKQDNSREIIGKSRWWQVCDIRALVAPKSLVEAWLVVIIKYTKASVIFI